MDEVNHHPHPNINNVLYVNLERLAQADTQAGELANVLIGEIETPIDPKVKLILKNLKSSFEGFREDNKVRDTMTRKEEIAAEERAKFIPIIAEKDRLLQKAEDDKFESARSMLSDGLPPSAISKHLKLSIEVIESLN